MRIEEKIVRSIRRGKGVVVLRSEVASLGSTAQVGRVLAKLVTAGKLVRVSMGVYAKTRLNKFTGQLAPVGTFESIAAEVFRKLNIDVSPGRAARDYNEGKTTQIPITPVVNTGRRRISRKIQVGTRVVAYERDIAKHRACAQQKMENPEDPIAISVIAGDANFTLLLKDGRDFRIPWRWFPKLLAATPDHRNDARVSASGAELHWDQLDQHISVSGLMRDFEHLLLEEKLSSQVPVDFPWDSTPALLSGTQPKLAGRLIDGRFVVGLTAEERYIRWDMCEDLAQQLVPKTLKDAAKYPQHSRDITLKRMRRAIEGKRWTEGLETDWLMQRLGFLLGW